MQRSGYKEMTTDFLYTKIYWRILGKIGCHLGWHPQVLMGFYLPSEFFTCACGKNCTVTHEESLREYEP